MSNSKYCLKPKELLIKFEDAPESVEIDFHDFCWFSDFFNMLEIDNSNYIELDPKIVAPCSFKFIKDLRLKQISYENEDIKQMLDEVEGMDLISKIVDLSKAIDFLQIKPQLIDFVKLSELFKN